MEPAIKTRETIFQEYEHIFNTTIVGEIRAFEINLIELFSQNVAQRKMFTKNPTAYLKQFQQQLFHSQKVESFDTLMKKYQINIVFREIPFLSDIYKRFDELNSNFVGKWIVIRGTIIQSTQKKTLQKSKVFKCDKCDKQYRIENNYQNYYHFEPPGACDNIVKKEKSNNAFTKLVQHYTKKRERVSQDGQKEAKMGKCGSNKYTPTDQHKVCIDYQQLRIQEHFKHIESGKLPQNMTVLVEGEMANIFRPGDDVIVSGILDYRYKKPIKDMKIQCQVIIFSNYICLQRDPNSAEEENYEMSSVASGSLESSLLSQLSLSLAEEALDVRIAKRLKYRDEVIENFAPTIFGRENVKLGLLLSLLGGVSYQNQNTKIRGQSHILLIGDPGTGKSVLIQQIAKLSARSFYTTGIGTSSAGLSVSYYKDGQDWMIEAGALVLADNGLCAIDELSLVAKKEEKALLEAMEQQTISSAKASIVGKFNTRVTVVAACNSISPGQKYNYDVDLEANTGLSLPLLSRFDQIMILNDENDRVEDSQKCDHILDNFVYVDTPSRNGLSTRIKVDQTAHQHRKANQNRHCLKSLIRKCKLYAPELVDTDDLLSRYYTMQRDASNTESKKSTANMSVGTTTARAFESLCRLSEAHAKLMMQERTSTLDCITAIALSQNKYFSTVEEYHMIVEDCMEQFGIEISP